MISIALIAFLLLFSTDLETENARLRIELSERIIVELKLHREYEMQMFMIELNILRRNNGRQRRNGNNR